MPRLPDIHHLIKHYLSSQHCPFCTQTNMPNLPLCRDCFNDLPWDSREPGYADDENLSAFNYRPPISTILLNAKFGKQLADLQWLAELTAVGLKPKLSAQTQPDAILPVPLHVKRLRSRGFNQALELARPLAKQLKLPLLTNTITRQRHTQAQSRLDAQQRAGNVRAAFELNTSTHYKHIALFDDVITTGATLNEIKQVLLQNGVLRVDLWSCARTMP